MSDTFDTTPMHEDSPGIAAKKARLRAAAAPADATAVKGKLPIKAAQDNKPEQPSALGKFLGALKQRASGAADTAKGIGSGFEKMASMTSDALKPVSDSALDADKERFIKQPINNAKAAAKARLMKLVGMRGL